MITYVINTSDNKIFDSNLLFELAGYNKIRWMHSGSLIIQIHKSGWDSGNGALHLGSLLNIADCI